MIVVMCLFTANNTVVGFELSEYNVAESAGSRQVCVVLMNAIGKDVPLTVMTQSGSAKGSKQYGYQ